MPTHTATRGPAAPALALALAAALGAATALPFAGTAGAQTLTIGVGAPVTSIDPHYHNASPNHAMGMHIFGSLVDRDVRAQLMPSLAVSWRVVDENTWEFKLREGVTWQDGSPFTAEDVAFTLARVPRVLNSPGSYVIYTRAAREVQIIDPHTVRIRTNGPYPLMANDLAQVILVNRKIGLDVPTEAFNDGRAAIGIGPYRMTRFVPGQVVELERNERFWGQKPHWQRVNYRIIANDTARTAALLAGDVDVIDQVPTSDLARLRANPRLSIAQVTALRSIFLMPDHSRDGPTPFATDNNGRPLASNPMRDPRVRRALSHAINRQAIVERVMENVAVASGQWLPPGTFGYTEDVQPPAFDPDLSRRLLAEAGYPNGFRLTFHTSNDRYPNDSKVAQAIAQMWTRVGVQTQVEALPWNSFITRAARQDFSIHLVGWGASTGEGSSPLRALVSTFNRDLGLGSSNRGRYSNPALDTVIGESLRTVDDEKRLVLFQRATRMAFEDVAVVPLYQQVNVWAVRRGIEFEARMDERTVAMSARPAN
ncbi:MAG: ABC transporter substrate-binding protein [Alphaproteobacteria bacterium]|nr:ABC transporter substrate-binding protein [Alphaproteobacteria bacterium]